MESVKAALDFFHEGAWPMWPILVLGVTAFAFASRLALTAERVLVGPVLGLSLASLLAGCFGFRHALSHTYTDCFGSGADLALVSLREALHGPILALGLVMPSLLLGMLGISRATSRST